MFFLFLKKNATLQILELFCFLLAHFNSFFYKYLFFKFTSKYQKEMRVIFCLQINMDKFFAYFS